MTFFTQQHVKILIKLIEKTKMKHQPQNPTYRLVKKVSTNPPNKKPSATDVQRESEDREE